LSLSKIGFILLPRWLEDNTGWEQIHKCRYAPVQGEALAVADALEKARHVVLGCNDLIIAVDQKSLLQLFGDRSFENIPNARLCNLKEKTLRYKFTKTHIPWARHRAADAVSRHPVGKPDTMVLVDDLAYISPEDWTPATVTLLHGRDDVPCRTPSNQHDEPDESTEAVLYSSDHHHFPTVHHMGQDKDRNNQR